MAIYLLDVSGHGVGPSLLSVAAGNALRSRSLPGVDFADPAAVLAGLNAAFPLDRTDGKFLTAWYGVYDATDRSLAFASAGHHEALLVPPAGSPTTSPSSRFASPEPVGRTAKRGRSHTCSARGLSRK